MWPRLAFLVPCSTVCTTVRGWVGKTAEWRGRLTLVGARVVSIGHPVCSPRTRAQKSRVPPACALRELRKEESVKHERG